jgi:replicative DNA helicase
MAVGGYALSGEVPAAASRPPRNPGYFIEKVREQRLLREVIAARRPARLTDCTTFPAGIDEFVDQVEAKIFERHRRTA